MPMLLRLPLMLLELLLRGGASALKDLLRLVGGGAGGDEPQEVLESARAAAQQQLEEHEGESEEHGHHGALPYAPTRGCTVGTSSLVTRPVSAVSSSSSPHQRATLAGRSTTTVTTGALRRSRHALSPCGV